MKSSFFIALTMGTVLAVPMQAKALNVEACAANPMTSRPQVINLLRPLDSSLLHCIPELSSIAGRWNSQARRITAAVNRFKIGNNGKATVERLEFLSEQLRPGKSQKSASRSLWINGVGLKKRHALRSLARSSA